MEAAGDVTMDTSDTAGEDDLESESDDVAVEASYNTDEGHGVWRVYCRF